ncbi:hypothetical protein AtDm6_1995 [Acetobacter tropicalis]|uniref:Uncharacterized protein n=1 Tax=Acetobacter tropicalis TaxID=104102 RepID=A0A094YL81_9PROT|nr:hypothetical protein AtDm6_1995 [Acetobacter tropicalis]
MREKRLTHAADRHVTFLLPSVHPARRLVAGRWQVSWLADYGLLIQPSRFLMKTVAHVLRDQTRSIPPTVAGAASDYAFKVTH